MVGPDFIPCFESLVFKLPNNGSSVPWHRDGNPIPGNWRIFNVDIYLDDSRLENGPERANKTIQQGWEMFHLPGAVPAEVEAGDILLHHTKVLHGSQQNFNPQLRRVIYSDQRTPS